MDSKAILTYAKQLFNDYNSYRVNLFENRKFTPESMQKITDGLIKNSTDIINIRVVGSSFQQRPIRLISAGTGPTHILLWSQMHGDESTATMAINDILRYMTLNRKSEILTTMVSSLSLHFLPMLNPDGALTFQRRTAQGIDLNRDALALVTPEAKILKNVHQELKPGFGFNLHDQELSSVGPTRDISAMSLLAPPVNSDKNDNEVRVRAKHIAAMFAQTINQFVPGKVTKYVDSFEPRAFGDNLQMWGTSTVLIESGHLPGDPEKDFIRKLNFVGILSSLFAIANNQYLSFDVKSYENLPFAGKNAYDLIIRNVLIKHDSGELTPVDLAVSYQVDTHTESVPILTDVGDLRTFVGLREIDGKRKRIPQSELKIDKPFNWESRIIM